MLDYNIICSKYAPRKLNWVRSYEDSYHDKKAAADTTKLHEDYNGHRQVIYRIEGKFGRDFNLAVWQIVRTSLNLNSRQIYIRANNKHDVMRTTHMHICTCACTRACPEPNFSWQNSTSQSWSCRMVPLHLKNSVQAADIFWATWPTIALLHVHITATV